MSKKSGIYYIQNIITNQLYIGQTVDLRRRKTQHLRKLKNGDHPNTILQNSFNKYGEDAFTFGVLIYCEEKDLDELEISMMDFFNVKKKGFNICDGGVHICPDNSNENHGMYRHDISNDDLKRLYLDGYSSKKLAKMYNCSYRTIQRRLVKIFGKEKYDELKYEKQIDGLKKHFENYVHDYSVEDILSLAEQGYNTVHIGEILNCSDTTVRTVLKKEWSDEKYKKYKQRNINRNMKKMRDIKNKKREILSNDQRT